MSELKPYNSKDVVLLMSYPRTGGTMLSKLLKINFDINLVSEVHPNYNDLYPLSFQVKEWFGLDSKNNYDEDLKGFIEYTHNSGKIPIIRDFSFSNFEELDKLENPSLYNLNLLQSLNYKVKKIAIVRDAFDVWLSQKTPTHFGKRYLAYVTSLKSHDFQIFKFEDICTEPDKTTQKIGAFCELEINRNNRFQLSNNEFMSGDITSDYNSRGFGSDQVLELKRRPIPALKIKSLKKEKEMIQANRILGYDIDFFNAAFQKHKIRLF